MTIAVGVIAEDGSVALAADSQEVAHGYWKRGMLKIDVAAKRADNPSERHMGLLISGAGRAGYVDALIDRIGNGFRKSNNADGCVDEMSREVHEFHKDHVQPYDAESSDVRMIFALGQSANQRGRLFTTDRGTVANIRKSAAVGIGSGHAESLLFDYEDQVKTCEQAVLLAAFVVHHTKRHVADCGNFTMICCVVNGTPYHVPYDAVAEMDKAFDSHLDTVQVAAARILLGTGKPRYLPYLVNELKSLRRKLAKHAKARNKISMKVIPAEPEAAQ